MNVFNRTVRRMVGDRTVRQKTLKRDVECGGVALHSGDLVNMRICAAAPNSGIRFRRTDRVSSINEIDARYDNVIDTRLCTSIANEYEVKVSTIEHLMAALSGSEIDNAVVELDGEEVPVMDGSAAPFIALIERAGIIEQNLPRKTIRVLRTVSVQDGSKFLKFEPADRAVINLEIDFDCESIGRQSLAVPISKAAFHDDVANARTFGFLHEVQALRAAGLARGGSLENAVVLSGGKVLNEEGLRHSDEFVRHKILDCIGDLYLAGAPIIGAVSGSCSGHALNNDLLFALFENEDAWAWETAEEDVPFDTNTWEAEPALMRA